MTGLEKIIEKIDSDAREACGEKLETARKSAEKITADGTQAADAAYDAAVAQADAKAALDLEKARSAADMLVRREMLTAKSEIINSLIEEALAETAAMDANRYFAALRGLIAKYADSNAKGELLLSPADIGRMPADFMRDFPCLTAVSDEKVDNGFVLRYGGIEQNCTFTALFECERDNLKDALSRMIFA